MKAAPGTCPSCGSDDLFSGHFDADGLAVPVNIDSSPVDLLAVRWTTFCNQCGDEVVATNQKGTP